MIQAIDEGRQALAGWVEAQPRNFFEADRLLGILAARAGLDISKLRTFGGVAASSLDEVAVQNNETANLPALADYDGIGRHIGGFAHHPSYHVAGKHIYESGVMAAYENTPNPHRLILSLFYLSTHVGESGHNCPLACTAGAIRALQALGTESQRERWLPGLLRPVYEEHFAAAQFLTEVQGGSDVGTNACVAKDLGDGRFEISGEKWFCSSADADLFLMTARPEAAGEGTRGLGLFLAPRLIDGEPNGFRYRRLKDKLGTRTMVTAEIEFDGLKAEALGPLDRGFQHTMEYVIDTSRLYNAFGCAALAHRAYLVARGYAEHRRAFGHPIFEYPLVRETLSFMRADAEASLAGSFLLAGLQEKVDAGQATDAERSFLRMGLNLNKVRTAIIGHDAINHGIEILGGNGTIETFSVLPRLLRDNVVFENWEGTHHTLRMQVLRDAKRLGLHHGFFEVLGEHLGSEAIKVDREAFEQCLTTGDTLLLRRVCDRLGTWLHLGALATVDDPGITARAELSRKRHLSENPIQPDYSELIERC